MLLVRTVRKVDARDVEPRLHQRSNDGLGGGCGSERADDLRTRNRRGQVQVRWRGSRQRYASSREAAGVAAFEGVVRRALTPIESGRLIRRSQRAFTNLAEDHDMPIGRRIMTLAALALAAGAVACSSDSAF